MDKGEDEQVDVSPAVLYVASSTTDLVLSDADCLAAELMAVTQLFLSVSEGAPYYAQGSYKKLKVTFVDIQEHSLAKEN